MEAAHWKPYAALNAAIGSIDLRGKSVLITGGGYGIGVFIAREFAARSVSHIILVGRNEENLQATASSLSSSQTRASYYTVDISSRADVTRLFDCLDSSPDYLINNAGYMPDLELFVDADLDEWWRGFTVNVYGTVLITQSFLRHRRTRQVDNNMPPPPAIVVSLNTLSAFSIKCQKLSAYATSKAALARWNELMPSDISPTEARFVAVHPGALETDMLLRSGFRDTFPITDGSLTGRFVIWLVSEDASFLSGRFVWANWDIEEMLQKKDTIIRENLFTSSLSL